MPKYSTVIPTSGPSGNTLVILATATRFMKLLHEPKEDIDALRDKVMASGSYEEALGYIRKYFPLEGDDEETLEEDLDEIFEEDEDEHSVDRMGRK